MNFSNELPTQNNATEMNLEFRNCSGAVLYRFTAEGAIEYLIVTSTLDRNRWVLPKGGIEPGYTAARNAVKECAEEGGYTIAEPTADDVVDVHTYRKTGSETTQKVTLFMAQVQDEVSWEEAHLRTRKWVCKEEAMLCITYKQRPAIRKTAILLNDTQRARRIANAKAFAQVHELNAKKFFAPAPVVETPVVETPVVETTLSAQPYYAGSGRKSDTVRTWEAATGKKARATHRREVHTPIKQIPGLFVLTQTMKP